MNTHRKTDRKAIVFVSSTYEDLKEHRAAVMEALQRMETRAQGMELFGAKSAHPKQASLEEARNCDVYIGIVATSYGSIDDETGKSYTQLEYEEAQKRRVPTLIYMMDEESQKVLTKFVYKGEDARLLEEFKKTLKVKHTPFKFTSPASLSKRVSEDLPDELVKLGLAVENEISVTSPPQVQELFDRF